ncbi:MAG TPA: lycopene cyclase domain-containing protein [Thermoanaerobaculia bacterium]
MVAARYEYLFLLLVFALVGASVLSARAQRAMRTKAYWVSLLLFMIFGTAVDLIAIHWEWWEWSAAKICGLRPLNIPIEEYVLFIIAHMTLVATWEALDDVA